MPHSDPSNDGVPHLTPSLYRLLKPCQYCEDESLDGVPQWSERRQCYGVHHATCGKLARWPKNSEIGIDPAEPVSLSRNGFGPKIRQDVFARDGHACLLCGLLPDKDNPLEVAHIISRAEGLRGGLTTAKVDAIDNLFAACRTCNNGIGDRSINPAWIWERRSKLALQSMFRSFTRGQA